MLWMSVKQCKHISSVVVVVSSSSSSSSCSTVVVLSSPLLRLNHNSWLNGTTTEAMINRSRAATEMQRI